MGLLLNKGMMAKAIIGAQIVDDQEMGAAWRFFRRQERNGILVNMRD